MNRLIRFVISFVLPFFCLLISVSNAFIIEPNTQYTAVSSSTSRPSTVGGYSFSTITSVCTNYYAEPTNEEYISAFSEMMSALADAGYDKYFLDGENETRFYSATFFPASADIGVNENLSLKRFALDTTESVINVTTNVGVIRKETLSSSGICGFIFKSNFPFYTNADIKQLDFMGLVWDGSSYYYKATPEEETPELPTNSEIAQAVQAFYDSDYYKNNKDFSDFIVMYNYNTQYFSFIGHNYEDKFQQLIFPAGYKYNQQWWKFGLDGLTTELSSYIFDKYYWLYSTNDFGENFSYDGKGLLSNLLELNFSTSSTIVYSTNEYDVVVYSYNENNELTSEMDTIPGDQYTYDENLDPTTNEYNPLENFVPTNPSQSILGDVDFNEINKVFEENKDILNIENASWLFSANNQLVSYFLGFLLLLIVFLIISRVLGG